MTASPAQTVAELSTLLGPDSVIGDPARMGPYLNEPRKRYHVGAAAIVMPRSVAEVQAVARWANERGIPLIPQGGNTGLVGGQVPLSGREVIISLTRLDAVREVDATAGHITVEAGMTLEAVHRAADAAGTMFPLYLASQGSARVGGLLGTNAGGVQVLAYGNARALCLGIEAVLADGRLYSGLNALKKDNTGYDLRDLLIGSEGTLGIITAATLKLFPAPEGSETAFISVASPDAALKLFSSLRDRAGPTLTAFELMPRFGIDMQLDTGMLPRDPSAGPSPWYVLAELSRPVGGATGVLQSSIEAAFTAGLIDNAVLAESLADRTLMWAAREQMSDAQSKLGASIKHDVSVPIAAVPQLIAEGGAATIAAVPGIRPCPFGHMGDGNLHFNFSQPVGADPKAFMAEETRVNAAVYEVVLRLNGSISAEHGIGQLKSHLLQQVKDPVALQMMAAIKAALDPKGILNPGKVLM